MIPIYKNKGDIQDCGNYRGIKLTSHTMKIWERIIDRRLREVVQISNEQFGFMPGRSTTDAIYALRLLMEKYREGQQELHCVFIDLEKAYDRVPREEVGNCLRQKGVTENYIRLIQDMYQGSSTQIRCTVGLSETFEVKVGVHQGSALSPFLFAIIMDCLTEEVRRESPWDMMFADDVVLCTEKRGEVERRLEEWTRALEQQGMKVNRTKTEYLATGGGAMEEGSINLQAEPVKRVAKFKYLGSTVQEDGGADQEVLRRIQAGWNSWRTLTGVLCDKKVPTPVKGRLYKTMVRPAMLYGMEAVAVTKRQEKQMEVAEMRMLSFPMGLTRKDKVRNEVVRERMGVGELSGKLRETRMRWYGHVTRRDDEYVGKRVQRLRIGKRKRGRPKRRIRDCFNNDMEASGLWETDAGDRGLWKRKIRTGDPIACGKSL